MAVVDIFAVYMFLKRLVTPFDQTKAFQLGLIDAEGNRLKKASTPEEREAMTYFDRLVFNLKRLLAKVPGGNSRLATFAAALMLLREQDSRLLRDDNYLLEEFNKELANASMEDYDKLMELFEDVGANATGAAVVGTGDNQATWKKSRLKKGVIRRKKWWE